MNDKQQLAAMGAEMAERQQQPLCMAKRIEELERKCKAAMEVVRDLVELPYSTGGLMERLEVRERARDLLAGQLPDPAVTVTETIRTAPERIWLQIGDQSHYHSEPFQSDTSEVSWCADSVIACEVPYVRADLAGKAPEQHKTNWPDKCPITRRNFFMEIDGVPTYGGPYDSYTIPEMLGTPEQPWHDRELFVRRFDHDRGCWVDDEIISQRVIHDGVLDDLLGREELSIPEGWQLVPVEPTAHQVLAGRNAKATDDELCVTIYLAMLSAAPKHQGGEPCDSASPSSSPD